MGEAKRNREALKAAVLAQLDRWDFPPSEAEAAAVAEIQKLPAVQVTRYPRDRLEWMKMPPNQCHPNTRFMVDNDPERRVRQVTGWLPEQGSFVLHSVIEQSDGGLYCVTPTTVNAPDIFPFIPDPDIEWREEEGFRVPYRKGLVVEPGLRTDPAEHARIARIVRERINAGIHPFKAGEPPF